MDIKALKVAEDYADMAKNSRLTNQATYYIIRAIYFLLVYYLPKMVKGE